nr:PKD domain-containing protein [Bacteroidota bacterium]
DAVIDHAEYYIDNDPGFGNGTAISLSSGKIVDVAFNLDISGLDNGLHILNIRARTDDGAWSLTHTHHILTDVFQLADAEISEIEYFFDADPGPGNGTSVSVSAAKVVDVTFQADLSGLSPGVHFLCTRAKTDDNTWGNLHIHPIFVDVLGTIDSEITEVEYFIDTDPGFGNATSVDVLPGNVVELAFEIDLDGIDPGFHFINVRSMNEDNVWSHSYYQLFLLDVLDSGEGVPVSYVEYFLDDDPGYGNATQVSITPGNVVELAFEVDLDGLDAGFHFANVRSMSENNVWSHAYTQLFLLDVLDSGNEEPITYVEYFLDDDPGYGNATSVSITPGKVVELAFEVDLDGIDPGFHFANVRSKSANDVWSHAYTQLFLVDVLDSNEEPITYVEYFLDEDPGYGNATSVSITPGKVVELAFEVDLDGVDPGFHFINVRSKSENEVWSHSYYQLLYVDVLQAGGDTPLNYVEYYFDNDPGFGNATQVDIVPSPVLDINLLTDISSLATGFHTFAIRAQDENEVWSTTHWQMFYIENISSVADPNLVSLEYFVDEDPGFGNGTIVAINPPVPVADQDFVVNLGSLELGDHILYTRALDEFDNWSIVAIDTFNVEIASEFALRFDGENDYLEAGDVFFPEDDLTIEAWINPAELTDYHEIIFWYGDSDRVQFRLQPDGSLLYGESANGNWSYVTTGSSAVQTNFWTHVAVTKVGDLCNLFVNGIHAGFYQFDNNPVTHTLQIGGRGNDMDRFFNGDIDEVRIWDVARSQEEIMDSFCANLIGNEEGIYGLWHFNDGPDSSVASDSGPNGFGAWLYNMEPNAGPDCSWIEHGCTLPPATDLALAAIISPEELMLASESASVDISVMLKNFGIESYEGDVTVSYEFNGSGSVSETISVTLPTGDAEEFTFSTLLDLSVPDIYEIMVYVSAPGDENSSNDTLLITINSVEIAHSVYAYNTYANQSGLPEGPVVFDLENPEYLFSLADQGNEEYLKGGTWMDDKWWAIANDTLYTIDIITGNRTFVGVPGSFISSLAYDPVDDKLLGYSWVSLYEIDPVTGNSNYVGYSGTEGFVAMACTDEGNLYTLNVEDDQLYQVDKSNGQATAIGPIGFDANYEQDMEYDPVSGNIYMAAFNDGAGQGELRTIDPSTGNSTYLGTFRGGMEITGFAIPFGNIEPPIADFNADVTSGFAPLEVQFTDLSTQGSGVIDEWYWDFGDGNNSAIQNPDHIYETPGTYTVSLTVTDINNLSDTETKVDYIEVFDAVVLDAEFEAVPTSGFVPLTVNFTDLSTGNPTSWEWDFENDGMIDSYDQNPDWVYDEAGLYSVKLTVYDNKSASIEIKEDYINVGSSNYPFTPVWINPYNPMTFYVLGATFSGIDLQAGDEIGIFDVDPITGGEICVGAGTLVQPLVGGEYLEVIASMDDGLNPDQADGFTPGNSFIFMLYSQTSGLTEDVAYAFPYPGYDEVFTSQGTTMVNLSTSAGLNANFSADLTSGNAPLTVHFTDLSTGNPTSWEWDFQNDGTVDSYGQSPEWIYNESGIYTVSLTVTDVNDLSDTETKVDYIEVFDAVVLYAEFEAVPTSGFVPLTVNFTDLSTGEPDSWLWDFGDGEVSTLQHPGHEYATFGIYTVSLTVFKGEEENTEIKEDYIEVYQTQNGDWSQQHVCLDNTPEAELMIRAGDIDNLGFGWPNGFDPFTGQSTPQHGFPWTPVPGDAGGTDRIMVVSSYTGTGVPCGRDGYTNTTDRPDNLPEPIIIDLCQLSQGEISSAALQIFVDDIQPQSFCSQFTVKLNGQTFAPLQTFINTLNQTGPIGRMLTVRIPEELLYLLEGEQLELEIDDFTTGAGDGFSIDFVKLLINEGALAHSGSIDGNVYDAETSLPLEGAAVEASFWETALTISDGSYNITEVPAGLVYIECRKAGYQTETKLVNLSSGNSYTANFWLD